MTGKNLYFQLPLNINLKNNATFENFQTGQNAILLSAVKTYPHVYIWGETGIGKTHLLEAACYDAHKNKRSTAYLSLKNIKNFSSEILEGLEFKSIVCIDDLAQITGSPEWEKALFHFYNQALAHKTRLLISANVPPHQLNIQMPDLKSRLSSSLVFQIKPLSDSEKLQVLQEKASHRGLELTHSTASYLMTRYSRNMAELVKLLEILDKAALSAQRKLTIPLVRSALHSQIYSNSQQPL